jgi:hypothetical protein
MPRRVGSPAFHTSKTKSVSFAWTVNFTGACNRSQSCADALNPRQFDLDPGAEAPSRKVENIVDQRGHPLRVGFDPGDKQQQVRIDKLPLQLIAARVDAAKRVNMDTTRGPETPIGRGSKAHKLPKYRPSGRKIGTEM